MADTSDIDDFLDSGTKPAPPSVPAPTTSPMPAHAFSTERELAQVPQPVAAASTPDTKSQLQGLLEGAGQAMQPVFNAVGQLIGGQPAMAANKPEDTQPAPAQADLVDSSIKTHQPRRLVNDKAFQHDVDTLKQPLDIRPSLLSVPPHPKAEPSLAERVITPIGHFGAGIMGGAVQVGDAARALMEAPFKLGASSSPEEDWQSMYEKNLFPGYKDSPEYKVGDGIGKFGTYAGGAAAVGAGAVAAGAPATLGAAATVATGALEGGVTGSAQAAKEDLSKSGRVNPGHVGQEALINAGIGTLGGGMSVGINAALKKYGPKILDKMADVSGLKRNIGKAVRKAGDVEKEAEGALEKVRKKVVEDLQHALREHDINEVQKLAEHFKQPPPENFYQERQREALEALYKKNMVARETPAPPLAKESPKQLEATVKANAQDAKKALESAGKAEADTAARGKFRLRKRGIGYNVIDYAKTAEELKDHLSHETLTALQEAARAMGEAKSALNHLENEVEAYAQNALNHAKSPQQLARVEVQTEERLSHKAAEELGKKKHELYIKQIGELDAAQQRMRNHQDLLDIPTSKYLYAIADRAEMQVPRKLASSFQKAYEQFVEASQALKAARKQYDALRDHFVPAFEKAERGYQKSVGSDQERLWFKTEISHPTNKNVKTDMAIGLVHRPFMLRLDEYFQQELNAFDAQLRAQEENVVKEIAYKIGGVEKLSKQSGKDAQELLRKMGMLHPIAERLALVTALGVTAIDAPAQAEDGSTGRSPSHWLRDTGYALAATILAAKYGPAAAKRIAHSPGYYYARCFANTNDLLGMADKALGIGTKSQSLKASMEALGGKVIDAVINAPDDHHYLMLAIKGDVDMKLLSPAGQGYARDIRDLASTLRTHAGQYAQVWKQHYDALGDAEKDFLKPVDEAVHFVNNSFSKGKGTLVDSAAAHLFANASRAWFTANPKIWLANIGDLAISGPLQVGPAAMARAAKTYLSNPVIQGLINKAVIGGQQSHALQSISSKAEPLAVEQFSTRVMSLASMSHYFHTNVRQMRALGISNERDFTMRALTGKLPEPVRTDLFIKTAKDLAEMLGADPVQLTKGPIGRSNLGGYLKFVSQPERYARLVMTRLATDPKWVAASMAVMWQFGGHAVMPTSLRLAGYVVAPEHTAKLVALLDVASAGQRLLGNMATTVEWDPFLYPAMGMTMPGLEDLIETIRGLPEYGKSFDELQLALEKGRLPQAMAGNPKKEYNQKIQKDARNILQPLSLLFPMMGKVPTRFVAQVSYYLPGVLHNTYPVSIPQPFSFGSGVRPIKPAKVKSFEGGDVNNPAEWGYASAAEASARRMLGLPQPFNVTLLQDAQSVPKSKDADLKQLSRSTKIH